MTEPTDPTSYMTGVPLLSWARQDIEQRWGFTGGKFTRVNNWLTFFLAVVLTLGFYAMLIPIESSWFAQSFTARGPTPYFTTFFAWWSCTILFIKSRKLALQQASLNCSIVPESHDFILSSATADQVTEQIHRVVEDPRQFVLFNRILIALANLRNLGRIADVDDILRSQSENDEASLETSYSLIKGFVWAIPVLGFIGTVLGLSEAVSGFGSVLESTQDVSQIVSALKVVTGGLATAFETTLQALVAALAIQLALTWLKKAEEEFLDSCSEYCLGRIVNHLRIMPYEAVGDGQ